MGTVFWAAVKVPSVIAKYEIFNVEGNHIFTDIVF